jgi:type VI secretion system protein ImpJ
MSDTNRIVWEEGMFLRAQHFQQHDRWLEALVLSRTSALRPFAWGVTQLAVNQAALTQGQFALEKAAGIFSDGTPFSLPDHADHPAPLMVPADKHGVLVHLALPIYQPGAREIVAPRESGGRYVSADIEAADTHSAAPQAAGLTIARLKLRYIFDTDDKSGFVCLPVARIMEVTPDRRVTLDAEFLSPALLCAALPRLSGLLTELVGLVNQIANGLAGRLNAPGGAQGVADLQDFSKLQVLNRWQPLLQHWAETAQLHPETLYLAVAQMAGELASFSAEAGRRPGAYPGYRHEDLQRSFAPVVADLRRRLADGGTANAVEIVLDERRPRVYYIGTIHDRSILQLPLYVLCVQADEPAELIRARFPDQVKIGAVEQIRELVHVAMPGIGIRPLPVAPRQIPFYTGANYFELDRSAPHWQQMKNSVAFAVHVAGEFRGLKLKLWAIKG